MALWFAPTVHDDGDHGFISTLVGVAQAMGTSGYVGDGSNRWPAVHRFDAARLVRLALEKAPTGSRMHAVVEEGVTARTIAEAIGRQLLGWTRPTPGWWRTWTPGTTCATEPRSVNRLNRLGRLRRTRTSGCAS
ncbi:hypothetical protein [Lapillicoccus sp.]|uniref:hypothetical protein n=1 Tax=Lapillicoccus sp. TaxID=1909287 RepID=UPI0032659D31